MTTNPLTPPPPPSGLTAVKDSMVFFLNLPYVYTYKLSSLKLYSDLKR